MASLTSTPTTPSLDDLSDIDYSLLSESLSLDTISIKSLESIPPFPSVNPLPTFVTVNDTTYTKLQLNTLPASIATIPTPPRLKILLKEDLCISRWTESLVSAEAPGHTPWGEVEDNDATPWKPEGSLYAGDAFQEALSKYRQRPITNVPRQRSHAPNSQHRDALVFEREITLKSKGKTKRWSVQVPAGSMNSDLVDMMVELRSLNTYFKEDDKNDLHTGGLEKTSQELLSTPIDTVCTHPPSLIVSNSQCVIPLSLESAGSLHSAPKTLAARRGNKSLALAPLTIKTGAADPYPSVPTAFLGSPSSYCPTFEFSGESRPTAAFQDMISSLRSQCASLQVKTPLSATFQEEKTEDPPLIEPSPPDPLVSSNPVEGDDDWAFADSLLEKFPEFCVEQPPESTGMDRQSEKPSLESNLTDSQGAAPDPSLNDPSIASANPPSPSIAGSISPTFSSNSPRGILKRCKSVRFAETSPVNPISANAATTPSSEESSTSILQPTSTGSVNARSLKRPSPLRHTYSPQPKANATEPYKPSSPAINRQRPCRSGTGPSPISQPSVLQPKRPVVPKPVRMSTVPPANKVKFKSQDSQTLGKSFRNTLVSGKENKKPKVSSLANRHTMDENALRRASSAPSPPETLKSRMPVPLRNILTRFR